MALTLEQRAELSMQAGGFILLGWDPSGTEYWVYRKLNPAPKEPTQYIMEIAYDGNTTCHCKSMVKPFCKHFLGLLSDIAPEIVPHFKPVLFAPEPEKPKAKKLQIPDRYRDGWNQFLDELDAEQRAKESACRAYQANDAPVTRQLERAA